MLLGSLHLLASCALAYHIFDVAVITPFHYPLARARDRFSLPPDVIRVSRCNFVSVSAWRVSGMTMRSPFRTSPSSTDSSSFHTSRHKQNAPNGVDNCRWHSGQSLVITVMRLCMIASADRLRKAGLTRRVPCLPG